MKKVVSIAGSITVDELAAALGLPVVKLIGELFKNGIVATINQRLDYDTAALIVGELKLAEEVELERRKEALPAREERQLSDSAVPRPPIVAIMGHVDHGKTTLLDTLLGKKTAASEAGGITQHISAYQLEHKKRTITFLDTPGHSAFAALRQHSASLTDIVVLVVAADDGVKPQTVEAIEFAKNSNAKIIVAINKIDKAGADVNRVMAELASEHNMNPEEWGGDTIMVPVSAKDNKNLDKLLEMILLLADVEDLRADENIPACGLVIESHMEVGRGPVANLLITGGVLKNGDFVVANGARGKVRTMLDWRGKPKGKATPATPVTVVGFKDLPSFGDYFAEAESERAARQQAETNIARAKENTASTNVTNLDLLRKMSASDNTVELNVVVKADVGGSATSVVDSLRMIDTQGLIRLNIIATGVGNITENDLTLARGAHTILYGFNITISPALQKTADRDNIPVRTFRVIYELLDDAKREMEKLLAPEVVETVVGSLKVMGVFRDTKSEVIAGGEVLTGKVTADLIAKVIRDKIELGELTVLKVQKEKNTVPSAVAGEMCGLELKKTDKLTLAIGDKLEFISREIKARKL
ncbi:MAG: translation initiation factor IF-2 [Candidatus Nomurabacteria bacterium]|jgi:translation initiation factor IF-2|nr:translation initiation factor IF-2 [Candidatus Nomurabacteria bacterium]